MTDIKTFLTHHDVCTEGLSWALDACKDMQEFWEKSRPDWLIWLATRPGVLTKMDRRRFALAAAERVRHLMKDERSTMVLDILRLWIDGKASDSELEAARLAASRAAYDAASRAAYHAAFAAYRAASAASHASYDAAYAAASADYRAAYHAERDYQADWLRENTTPNFDLRTN